ncbi:membrane protein insertase YidC [bacterium]|nr:membrane protein insertase YidC [bacterium]
MDRNVLTATVLIALIMVVWLTWLAPEPAPVQDTSLSADTTGFQAPQEIVEQADPAIGAVSALATDDSTFVRGQDVSESFVNVETDLYSAVFSNRGGTLVSFKLKEYHKFESEDAVNMVDTTKAGSIAVLFTSGGSRNYDTRSFFFTPDETSGKINATTSAQTLTYSVGIGEGSMAFTYTFTPGSYEVGLSIQQNNASSFATQDGYELAWVGGIPFTEGDHKDEGLKSGAYARSGGEVEAITLASDTFDELSLNGDVDWIAVKNKYFAVALMADVPTRGAELVGERFGEVSDSYLRHDYMASLEVAAPGAGPDTFKMYIGPVIYKNFSAYNVRLYDMVDYGWDFFEVITRPLAKFVFIPAFTYLHDIIPSYGLVIILLALLIKIVLHPLTRSSFKSMGKMRELQPRMEAIKEKFADNPQKQQEAMMKMYKETGVNPLGGCLPMLLQYPIIIALWQFLPQAIELRQEGFLWAADLSAPDIILHLPFSIPMFGNFIAGFTLLMGLSMVFQMKVSMTNQNNLQAKIFTYVMPVMIFVIFNKLAAGLNLYYLCYNVLTALQQKYVNKQIHEHPEELKAEKKVDPKKGKVTGKLSGGRKKK